MSKIKKRFIAGAICPSCKQLDKIQMFKVDGIDYRECVACGFKDEMRFKPAVRELETRVNEPAEVKKSQTGVIKILPLDEKSKNK